MLREQDFCPIRLKTIEASIYSYPTAAVCQAVDDTISNDVGVKPERPKFDFPMPREVFNLFRVLL